MNSMQQQWQNSYLFGANANFIEELYEQYLINPQQLNPAWKNYFDSLQNGITDFNHQTVKTKFINLSQQKNQIINNTVDLRQHKVFNLIHHYRFLGVNCANLDPLQLTIIKRPQELELTYHGLSPNDLEDKFLDDYKTTAHLVKLKDIIARYEAIYCQNIGFEYTYITDQQERKWLIDYIESNCLDYNLSSPEKIHTLIKLTEAETLEKFLATTYVGQKRFSLEGAESLIPALDRIISQSAGMGIEELVIGMSHRGRINALINLAGKSPAKLFAEFEANYEYDDFVSGGDVKYHKGYQCNYRTPQGVVHITIAHNPSHLETVNPVVAGIVRAKQDFSPNPINVLGVLIHGDSALIGLGTNQGYFTSSQTPAYGTLGMIHISVNNQVGFTNSKPSDNRSSRFNTDIVKMIDAPVIHVNGDDLTKVLFAMDMAIAYRQKFNRDIMIDLVCFRRHGHNEADDPSLTQPAMYRKIRSHLGIRKLYGTELSVNKILTATAANQMVEDFRSGLTKGVHWSQDKMSPVSPYQFELAEIKAANWRTKLTTAIDQIQLLALAKIITTIPQDFNPHPTLVKTIDTRIKMATGALTIDFGMAESLAYASLLQDGISVRISGEDSRRGTFTHRHGLWYDYQSFSADGTTYSPFSNLTNHKVHFALYDSILNEEAVLGFEYGYSQTRINDLVIWEAQFGDFANGAQVIIDQFIVSGESKWGIINKLCLILPHGYDGQGPEHSSARIERFLQLAGENNLQAVIPSTASQMFHLLRRQGLSNYIKPLIIFMSKRLLRYKGAMSEREELITGEFKVIIPETTATEAKRVLLCSGQVYYDLVKEREVQALTQTVAIIRIEQLYPFPDHELALLLKSYSSCENFFWIQEEPYNQGAWLMIREELENLIPKKYLHVVCRPRAAAPACGFSTIHQQQLQQILAAAFL